MPKITANKPSGEITFYQYFDAPLPAGDYTVTVTQTAASSDATNPADETFTESIAFAVLGPRFSLPPQYIHTQFPPPGIQGNYANVLPHIVFRRKTLPWQRLVQAEAAGGPVYPWLALLTFDVNDPPPELATGKVSDLMTPPSGIASYPSLQLEAGESADDACTYIDIPVGLFYEIVPTLSDLQWLAHAREIDRGALPDKAGGGVKGKMPHPDFSVVVSNRLPTPGNGATCFLVSLENMADVLPAATRAVPSGAPQAYRLAVLASWNFGAVELPQTFAEYFNGLNGNYTEPITPQIPYANATGTANTVVENAFAMGYTALNHNTRQGAATVSWYRGPLLPFANPSDVRLPAGSADALMQYDSSTGMFDVSLAAAWQLGQVLALADKDFSQTLYRWKRSQSQDAIAEFETQFLAGALAVDPSLISSGQRTVLAQVIDQIVKPMLKQSLQGLNGQNQQEDGQ